MDSSVSSYRRLSKLVSDLPIFMRPDWLDIVSPDSWGVVYTEDNPGKMTSALIFSTPEKYGVTWLAKPKLTPFNGIWLPSESPSNANRSVSKLHKKLEELIMDLPKSPWIEFNLHPDSGPLHAFHWKDYDLITRYTYRLSLTDVDELRSSYKNTLRTDIRQGENQFHIQRDLRIDQFCQFTRHNKHYRGLLQENQYRALAEAFPNDLFFWGALDASEALRAVALFLKSHREVYYLIGVTDKEPGNTALSFLLDSALHYFAEQVEVFDFEGSMVRPVESFFRRFGGTPTPYTVVRKSHPIMRWLRRLKG